MGGSSCGKIGPLHYGHPIYQMTFCPITCGLPTRMMKLTFTHMCEGRRIEGTYCGDVCRGTLPPELTLVTLAEMARQAAGQITKQTTGQSSGQTAGKIEMNPLENKENDMTKEREKGTCGLCGQDEKNCRDTKGVSCCSTCESVMRAAHNNPEAMFKALALARGDGFLQEMVGQRYSVPVEEQGLAGMDGEMAADLAKCNQTLSELGSENRGLKQSCVDMEMTNAQLRLDISRLKNLYAYAEEELVTALSHNSQLADEVLGLRGEMDGEEVVKSIEEAVSPAGYDDLWQVLHEAMMQSATGKGLERHGEVGVPFVNQPICTITRDVGLGFPLGQALKKVRESKRLSWPASLRELLGAIVYTAAAVIVGDEDGTVIGSDHPAQLKVA